MVSLIMLRTILRTNVWYPYSCTIIRSLNSINKLEDRKAIDIVIVSLRDPNRGPGLASILLYSVAGRIKRPCLIASPSNMSMLKINYRKKLLMPFSE